MKKPAKKRKRKIKPKRKPEQKLLPAPAGSGNIQKVELDPQLLLMKAVEGGASIDVLERLLNMSDRIKQDQAKITFRDAMAAFQAECPIIVKGTSVLNKDGKLRYKFAQIDAIIKEVKPYLQRNGFSYQIKSRTIDKPFEGVEATVTAHHVGGYSEESTFSSPIDKYMVEQKYMTLQQAWLSAQSFARRVAFCNEFGIMTGEGDIDGNQDSQKKSNSDIPETEEERKKREEDIKKIEMLPKYIKDGFGILKYTTKNIRMFCNKFEWDENKIKFEIDKIVAANEGSK